ncbi:putative bacteriophage protein [Shigella sonnei]|nr:putative bacteriophage protein [Shigella sonnei]
MAKPFTPEQREELKTRIVELVHQDGRVTIRQLRCTGNSGHYHLFFF